jgi:hypothetical protein
MAGQIGQMAGFFLSFLMIIVGVVLCLYSVYDRIRNAEQRAKRYAQEMLKGLAKEGKEGITTSPIPLGDINNIIEAIIKIENPFMQVGVFLTVFGILVMIISIFIPI